MEYRWTLNINNPDVVTNGEFKYAATYSSLPTLTRVAYWAVGLVSGNSQWLADGEKINTGLGNPQTGDIQQQCLEIGTTYRVRIKVDQFIQTIGTPECDVFLGTNLLFSINSTGIFDVTGVCTGNEFLRISKQPNLRITIDWVKALNQDEETDVVVEDPLNWDKIKLVIERDETLRGVFRKFALKPKFGFSGYEKILEWFNRYGAEAQILVKCEARCHSLEPFSDLFSGVIFGEDLTINLEQCYAESTIEFNQLQSILMKNEDLEVNLYSTRSLNGVEMTSPLTQRTITMIDGIDTFTSKGWLLYDVFDFLVRYLTDEQMSFEADMFANMTDHGVPSTGEWWGHVITFGNELRNITSLQSASISLKTLFKETRKIYAIAGTLEESGGTSTFKLVKEYDLYSQFGSRSFPLDYIPDLKQNIFTQNRFGKIVLGYSKYEDQFDATLFGGDQYGTVTCSFLGESHSGNTNQIVCDGVASVNMIRRKLLEGSTGTDKEEEDDDMFHIVLQSRFQSNYPIGADDQLKVAKIANRWRPLVWESFIPETWDQESNNGFNSGSNRTIKDFGDDPVFPDDLYLWYRYSFKYPLQIQNVNDFIDNPELFTSISPGPNAPGFGRAGHLMKLSFDMQTGMTTFDFKSEQ